MRRKSSFSIFQKPIMIAVGFLLLAFVAYHYVMSLKHGYELQTRVETLQTDIDELQARKAELEQMKELVESPDYVEREARSKLGLKKKGEHVIIVPSEAIESVPKTEGEALADSNDYQQMPNPERWFYYFFGEGRSVSKN